MASQQSEVGTCIAFRRAKGIPRRRRRAWSFSPKKGEFGARSADRMVAETRMTTAMPAALNAREREHRHNANAVGLLLAATSATGKSPSRVSTKACTSPAPPPSSLVFLSRRFVCARQSQPRSCACSPSPSPPSCRPWFPLSYDPSSQRPYYPFFRFFIQFQLILKPPHVPEHTLPLSTNALLTMWMSVPPAAEISLSKYKNSINVEFSGMSLIT